VPASETAATGLQSSGGSIQSQQISPVTPRAGHSKPLGGRPGSWAPLLIGRFVVVAGEDFVRYHVPAPDREHMDRIHHWLSIQRAREPLNGAGGNWLRWLSRVGL
jgi:hypothetical protein